MAIGGTIGTFSVITLAYFWIYYKLIIKKKITSEKGEGGGLKELMLHVSYFFLIISLQVGSNMQSFKQICAAGLKEKTPQIIGWTIIANVFTLGIVIAALLVIKQLSYPFEYTFGNMGCSRLFKQLIEKLREADGGKYILKWQTCIDISEEDPDKYKEEVGYDDVYKILCKMVMVRKVISGFIWYIIAGIYAIIKSNYYTVTIKCPGPKEYTDPPNIPNIEEDEYETI